MPKRLTYSINYVLHKKWFKVYEDPNTRIMTGNCYCWFIDSNFYAMVQEDRGQVINDKPGNRPQIDFIRSFHFKGKNGEYTVRKELRGNGIYWYAFRHVRNKVRKLYIGKTEELTISRLEGVASELNTTYEE